MLKFIKLYSLYIKSISQIGLYNVFIVLIYRIIIKSRLLEALMPAGSAYKGVIFSKRQKLNLIHNWQFDKNSVIKNADELINFNKLKYFSYHVFSVESPPSWFTNPFTGTHMQNTLQHFSRIGDFNNDIGDIKTIWEISRFDWAILLARAARLTGNKKYIDTINFYTEDWIKNNPYCVGPNWKCGQETSIRMLNLLLSAYILGQHKDPPETLIRFIYEHCCRIRPTIYYAIAQDNNHGTSEATALFVGGAWLKQYAASHPELIARATRWCRYGRKCLEERVQKLVEDDGSFSQKSLNYHRVLVDTLCLAEFWRRAFEQPLFSNGFYQRARKAVEWLYCMTDDASGNAPNLGANDGARFIQLSSTPYQDYRSSVQLGSAVFLNGTAYLDGAWDEPLYWLNLQSDICRKNIFKRESRLFDNGGYVILHGGKNNQQSTWGMLHYPRFKTRPSHADIFHFDLWYNGENMLRDSGSYSYATDYQLQSYLLSASSHNTIQFDGRDQMPKLGRFLFSAWPKPLFVGDLTTSDETQSWSGAYRDYGGCYHRRTILLHKNMWEIEDEIKGYRERAILRWRLKPTQWKLEGNRCCSDHITIEVISDAYIKRFEIINGSESLYYLEKNNIPVLEIEIAPSSAKLKTRIYIRD